MVSHSPGGARRVTSCSICVFAKHLMVFYARLPEDYVIEWRREVEAIDGNQIILNAPIVQAIEAVYGSAIAYKCNFPEEIQNVGIENMRIESIYASEDDENHGRSAVVFQRVTNAWMRHVTAKHFWYGAVNIQKSSMFVTVEDSAMLEHKGVVSSPRRYAFNVDDSEFVLFQRVLSKDGRHAFVSGSLTPGPNVWVDGLAIDSTNDSGPHHRYSTGQLYDNIKVMEGDVEGEVNARNRGSSGTGHGWSGAQILFWNTEATIIADAPNGGMNYAVGNVGPFAPTYDSSWQREEPNGIIQSLGVHVTPRSLYYSQLRERLGNNAMNTQLLPIQKRSPIWSRLETWYGEGLFMDPVIVWYDEDSGPVSPAKYVAIGGMLRDFNLLEVEPLFQWRLLSGPGKATFEGSTSLNAAVLFDLAGEYTLELSVKGQRTTSSATLQVPVRSAS
jgi:hypothetical protein